MCDLIDTSVEMQGSDIVPYEFNITLSVSPVLLEAITPPLSMDNPPNHLRESLQDCILAKEKEKQGEQSIVFFWRIMGRRWQPFKFLIRRATSSWVQTTERERGLYFSVVTGTRSEVLVSLGVLGVGRTEDGMCGFSFCAGL